MIRTVSTGLAALALAITMTGCADNGGDSAGNTDNASGGEKPAVASDITELTTSLSDATGKQSSAHTTFTAELPDEKITGEGDVRFGPEESTALRMDLDTADGPVSMVLMDTQLYIKTSEEIEPGKPWLKIDTSTRSDSEAVLALATLGSQLRSNIDLRQSLAPFQEAGTITDSKSEELDGTQTTHYSITVDVQKLADSQTDPTTKQALQQAITSGALKDFPVEMWVDSENLPARVALQVPIPDPATGTTDLMKVQVDYSKWGESVEITPPPAEQVAMAPA